MRGFQLLFVLILFSSFSSAQSIVNNDTCRTFTYYQYIGNLNSELNVSLSRTLADRGTMAVGSVKQAGDQQALMIRQDMNGRVLWQKAYGTNANDECFTSLQELSNGNLLLSGIVKERTTLQNRVFFIMVDQSGSILWQQFYKNVSTLANISDVQVSVDDNYADFAYAIQVDSVIVYGLVNNVGSMLWQKGISIGSDTRLSSIVFISNTLAITTNGIEGGFKFADFYFIRYGVIGNPKTISSSLRLGGLHQQKNYILKHVNQNDISSNYIGIRSTGNNSYHVFRMQLSSGFVQQTIDSILFSGLSIDSTSSFVIHPRGDGFLFMPTKKTKKVYAVGMTYTGVWPIGFSWSKEYSLPDSLEWQSGNKVWDQGSLLFGRRKVGNAQQLTQFKLDSSGTSVDCIASANIVCAANNFIFPTDTAHYSYNTQYLFLVVSDLLPVQTNSVDTSSLCRQIHCPNISNTDSCSNSYMKLYRSYEDQYQYGQILSINNRVFVNGRYLPQFYSHNRAGGFIAELNASGSICQQREFHFGVYSSGFAMSQTNDNHLLIYGAATDSISFPAIYIAKVDLNLNLVWKQSIKLPGQSGSGISFRIADVRQAEDGSYFVLFGDGDLGLFFGSRKVYLMKLDVNGNYIWSKVYRPYNPGEFNLTEVKHLEVMDNAVYMVCGNAYNSFGSMVVLKANTSDGTLIWKKQYTDNTPLYLNSWAFVNQGDLFLGGTNSNGSSRNYILKINTSTGDVVRAVTIANQQSNRIPGFVFLYDYFHRDSFHLHSSDYSQLNNSYPYNLQVVLNRNLDVLYAQRYTVSVMPTVKSLSCDQNGQVYESGIYLNNLSVIKFSSDGEVGNCVSDTLALHSITLPAPTIADISCTSTDSVFNLYQIPHEQNNYFLATNRLICSSVPACGNWHINGPAVVCSVNATVTFTGNRTAGCHSPIQWMPENVSIQVIAQTDSSITIRFISTGTFWIRGRLVSNCTSYLDSLQVHVLANAPLSLNLGNDFPLCSGDTVILNAHQGFQSYVWQDGSTDSVLAISTGGTYYVTSTDLCNNLYSDTVRVWLTGASLPLNIGRDTTFCESNVIQLNAHAGYLSYQWQDGSTDSIFLAQTPGIYFVIVVDSCNHVMRDSVLIKRFRSASSLNLGTDTTFCGTAFSFLLHAGGAFENYLWQDGSTDSTFLASSPGWYWVRIKDSCGNIALDSIHIFADSTVLFDLGPNLNMCLHDTTLLNINTGFTNYQWTPLINTIQLSADSLLVYPASSTWYFVSAIKPNGCTVKDSIFIQVNNLPNINLGNDHPICNGDTLILDAGTGYQIYNWSTGEHTPLIHVTMAGVYSVEVTDFNSCISSDTFTVTQVYSNPAIELGDDSTICSLTPRALHAGVGFVSYLWNSNESTESILINAMGTYWVSVTDANGCKNSDTLVINREFISPGDLFVKSDSSICKFESMLLSPLGSYNLYNWSTGESLPGITIFNEGDYWLQVVDSNGCKGADSFHLFTHDCSFGLYFPSAFTPNLDGVNDLYHPKVYGVLSKYQLRIYNRYGLLLFKSNQIANGWDGTFKGVKQPIGTYIWQCDYQLSGKILQFATGSLVLIR